MAYFRVEIVRYVEIDSEENALHETHDLLDKVDYIGNGFMVIGADPVSEEEYEFSRSI